MVDENSGNSALYVCYLTVHHFYGDPVQGAHTPRICAVIIIVGNVRDEKFGEKISANSFDGN